MKRTLAARWIGAAFAIGLGLGVNSQVRATALSAKREYEPVVIKAELLQNWKDTADLTKIGLFRYNASTQGFEAIPFQIDKRRKINLKNNINDPSTFAGGINVCEWGYFRELGVTANSSGDTFASNTLNATDEIVFMLFDAGTDTATTTAWISGSVDTSRYQITLTDPRNGATRYVYAFLWTSGAPTKSSTAYISWTSDANSATNCTNKLDSCGVAAANTSSLPGSVSVNTLKTHFLKNWVTDELHVNSSSSSFYADAIDRFQYQMVGESEDTWSGTGLPLFLGVYTSNTDKPVRVVRAVQGAASGADTTKYEFIYPTLLVTRSNLRVHAIPSLDARIDQDTADVSDNPKPDIWTKTSYEKSTPEVMDLVNATGPTTTQIDQDAAYPDWSELATKGRGSYVQFHFDPRPIPADAKHYTYIDRSGKIGMHGREWQTIGVTQDGQFNADDPNCPGCTINDGGCDSDPESDQLNFARFEEWVFPQEHRDVPSNDEDVVGPLFLANVDNPMTLSARPETESYSDPTPIDLCSPTVSSLTSTAGPVHASLGTTGCSSAISGFRLYRATGSGSYAFLKDLGAATSYTDVAVSVGTTYHYKVSSYNEVNSESSQSAASDITAADSTAPAVPSGVVTVGSNHAVTVTWSGNAERDLDGYEVWMANGSGGTYVKLNSTPLPAYSSAQWAQVGLTNGQTYCFKIAATDQNGNSSSLSSEVCAVPAP